MVAYNDNKFHGDIRQCRVAWRYINSCNGVLFSNYPAQNINLFNKEINNNINGDYNFLRSLNSHCDSMIIPKSELSWINNDRVIFFIYKQFEHMNRELSGPTYNKIGMHNKYFLGPDFLYTTLNISFNKTSAKEKHNIIIEMIDSITEPLKLKRELLEQLKKLYSDNLNLCDFSWFNRSVDNDKWLLDYMINLTTSRKTEYVRDNGLIEDRFHSAIEIFDMWDTHNDTKKLFILKLKKAYQQKIYRDNKSDKEKTYAYSMRYDISDLMNDLSIRLGIPKNKIVERLIREEHERIVGYK